MTTMTINRGTYTARATRWAWDTTQTEAVCLALMFRFTDEPHAEIDGRLYFDTDRPDDNGRTTADRSIEVLRAMDPKNLELPDYEKATGNTGRRRIDRRR